MESLPREAPDRQIKNFDWLLLRFPRFYLYIPPIRVGSIFEYLSLIWNPGVNVTLGFSLESILWGAARVHSPGGPLWLQFFENGYNLSPSEWGIHY